MAFRRICALLFLSLYWLGLYRPCRAATPATPETQDSEYRVKAAFLFNFLRFVEWPPSPTDAPWVIGILGSDPFGPVIEDTIRGKTVNGRGVEIRRFRDPADVKDCNILFIGRAEFERLAGVLPAAAMRPGVLSVGESPGFLKSGGAIAFHLDDNRVRFEILPFAARSAGLHVSAQLLRLGRSL